MSESTEEFLPAGTAADEGGAPISLLETRRARRARIEALEASLRSEFSTPIPDPDPAPEPAPMSEPMRRFGLVMSGQSDAAIQADAADRADAANEDNGAS